MTTSLVICTFNWKAALELVLLSATRQTVSPGEIVIADDGSREDTRELIDGMRPLMPCPVKHVWQENKGFRRAMAMNRAFAVCTGDYVIQIDGDIIMERHFIEDHIRQARRGCYLAGSRAKLTAAFSEHLYTVHNQPLHWWTAGVTRRLNAIRIPWLSPLLRRYRRNGAERGCNLSFWRDDLYAVNGYDNRMLGYGSEDTDLTARLRRIGISKRFVKFCCIEYHLYHAADSTKHDSGTRQHNIRLREHNAIASSAKVKDGIDQLR